LLKKGLIRIFLPVPPTAQYRIVSVNDPYGCNTNPVKGLTTFGLANPTAGIVSVYRRPLPSTNLGFLTTIMGQPRASLTSQAVNAALIHAQGIAAPTADQQQQMVAFESGLFTAQNRDNNAGHLSAAGATGGPSALANLLRGFFIGINDPLPGGTPPSFGNPTGKLFTSFVFDPYDAWSNIGGPSERDEYRRSVARGQEVFNTEPINITRVVGFNDTLRVVSVLDFCATCHDTPDVGIHDNWG
jgi:hypothetical protein